MNWLAVAERVLRFKAGDAGSWAERGIREQAALADLRQHAGFPAFLDALDADLANVFFQFLKAEPEETAKLAALHARGRTLQRVIRLLEDATQARSRAQAIEEQRREAERLMEAHKTHNARRRSAADTARAMAETTE